MVGRKTKTPSIGQRPPSPQMVLCNATPLMSRHSFGSGSHRGARITLRKPDSPARDQTLPPRRIADPRQTWEELRAPCGSRKERCFLGRFRRAAPHTFDYCKMQHWDNGRFQPVG